MRATRRTQPYRRKSARAAGPSLSAMLAGKPAHMAHPRDADRELEQRARRRRRRGSLAARLR